MKAHFNDLHPEDQELLAILNEECGEVVHIIGKILRHGLDSCDNNEIQNSVLLENEIGDLEAAISLLKEKGIVSSRSITFARKRKLKKIGQFLHHSTSMRAPN